MSEPFQGYTYEPKPLYERLAEEAAKPLSQRLNEQADALDAQAEQFKGCSWMGDEPPGSAYRRQASLLRQAALVALQDEQKKTKRRKTKVSRP